MSGQGGIEAEAFGHLTGARCGVVLGSAAHDGSHDGIEAEAFGVVDILIAGQAAVDRLAQQSCQAVLGVLSGARVVQAGRSVSGQCEGVIEFAVGEESGVTGDGRAVEFQLELAVEIESEGTIFALTHWVPRSFQHEVVGNAGFSEGEGANAMPKRPSHLGNPGLSTKPLVFPVPARLMLASVVVPAVRSRTKSSDMTSGSWMVKATCVPSALTAGSKPSGNPSKM